MKIAPSIITSIAAATAAQGAFVYTLGFGPLSGGETSIPNVIFGPNSSFEIANIHLGPGLSAFDDPGLTGTWEIDGLEESEADAIADGDYIEFTINTPEFDATGCTSPDPFQPDPRTEITIDGNYTVANTYWTEDSFSVPVDMGSNLHSPAILVSTPDLGVASGATSTTYRAFLWDVEGTNGLPVDGRGTINDIEIIVDVDFEQHDFACVEGLERVPEPSSLFMGLLAAGIFVCTTRRRHQR